MPDDLPYVPGTPDRWTDSVRASFKLLKDNDRWILSGDCPRCGHQVQKDVSDRLGAAFAPGAPATAISWRCSCGRPHGGAPPDVRGCGAEGKVFLKDFQVVAPPAGLPAETSVTPGDVLSAEERSLVAWGEKATADPLAVIRTAAQQWQTTISAIIGLFGAASIVGSDAAVASLEPLAKHAYFGLVALAVVVAAVAVYLAALAGQSRAVSVPADLARLRTLRDELTQAALSNLGWSRLLTLISILALVVATGVRWYAPKSPPQPQRIEWVEPAARR